MGVLRFILAIAVVLEHTAHHQIHLMKGYEAVHVFFMISGFYMCMILVEKYSTTVAGLKNFYINRFLRLYPSYLVVVLLSISWYYFCRYTTGGTIEEHPFITSSQTLDKFELFALWLSNFTLIGIDMPNWFVVNSCGDISFAGNGLEAKTTGDLIWLGYSKWVPQAWTIGSEIWFYLCAPLLLMKKPALTISVVAGISFFLLLKYSNNFMHDGYFIWIFWLWLFCLGMLLFIFYKKNLKYFQFFDNNIKLSRAIFALILASLLLPYLFKIPFSESALIGLSVVLIPILFHITRRNKVDRFIGELSYPIYISHLLVEQGCQTIISYFKLDWSLLLYLNMPLTVLFSLVLVLFVDSPIERLRIKIASSAMLKGVK